MPNPIAMQAAGRKRAAAMIGRLQAPELFFNGSFTAGQTLLIPRTLNLTRPLESLTIQLKFRLTVTVAPYTTVAPEAPQNILQKINIQGTHRAFGALTPFNISGASAFAWNRIFQNTGNDALVSVNSGLLTRIADPGRPFNSGFTGAVATHDFVVTYNLPVWPQMGIGQAVKRNLNGFLWMPQDWADSVQIQLTFGDATSFGDVTGATTAIGGFAGAANPQIQIHANYTILGQASNSVRAGVTLRQENVLTGNTATNQNVRLTSLQKRITPNVVIKTGVLQAAALTTAGVTTFASLSDTQLDRTQIQVDNKPVRNNQNNLVYKAYYGKMFDTVIPGGYFLLSAVDAQNPLLAYRGDQLSGGSTFEIISDITEANALNLQQFVQEQIIGGDFPA